MGDSDGKILGTFYPMISYIALNLIATISIKLIHNNHSYTRLSPMDLMHSPSHL